MITKIFNILFGIITFLLSIRYEVGIFNYLFGLNYLALTLFGLNVIWSEISDNTFIPYCMIMLSYLCLFNALTLLTFNKPVWISILRLLLVGLISLVAIMPIDIWFYIMISISVNMIMIIIMRYIHRDEFKFGTIHPRYVLITALLYLLVITELIIEIYFWEKNLHFYYAILPIAFMYDFQLILYYNSIRFGYSTFMRSGTFPRILLIVDYYEIPDTKV